MPFSCLLKGTEHCVQCCLLSHSGYLLSYSVAKRVIRFPHKGNSAAVFAFRRVLFSGTSKHFPSVRAVSPFHKKAVLEFQVFRNQEWTSRLWKQYTIWTKELGCLPSTPTYEVGPPLQILQVPFFLKGFPHHVKITRDIDRITMASARDTSQGSNQSAARRNE